SWIDWPGLTVIVDACAGATPARTATAVSTAVAMAATSGRMRTKTPITARLCAHSNFRRAPCRPPVRVGRPGSGQVVVEALEARRHRLTRHRIGGLVQREARRLGGPGRDARRLHPLDRRRGGCRGRHVRE